MSGRAGGFSVTISAVDKASAPIEAINKRLAALSAPADRFNKAVAKFGDTSGLSRVSEGVMTLGRVSADTFRSLDRLSSPLAAITGAASIAGIAELTRRWAEFGQQLSNTSYRLNMPAERLSNLRNTARLAGVSAGALDQSMIGLGQTLSGAAYGRNPAAIQLLTQLGVKFGDTQHGARQAEDALGDVADAISKLPDARTQERVLGELGISPELLPMLKKGRKGLEELRSTAAKTGADMTTQMTENAAKMNKAWQELGEVVEGVGNRIVDSWSGTVTKVLETSTKWIEGNKETADTIAKIGAAVGVLAALKPAAWVLRLLGLGAVAGGAGTAAVVGSPLLLSGDTARNPQAQMPYDPVTNPNVFDLIGAGWRRLMPSWLGGGPGYTPRSITAPRAPSQAAAVMEQTRSFWKSKDFTDAQVAGILAAGPAAESGFNPNAVGDNGTSFGLYQHHADRRDAMFSAYGPHPTAQQQNEFAWSELNQPGQANLLRSLRAAQTSGDAARVWTRGFEQPANGAAEAENRAAAAPQFEPASGNVHVQVELKNAPPGTTARVTTAGRGVTAGAPRIETSMPGVH